MGIAGLMGGVAAATTRRAERALHRMARPAAIALAPLLLRQAKALQAGLLWLPEPKGARRGTIDPVGVAAHAAPLRLLAIGDSTATGVGVDRLEDGLVLQTAARLADAHRRPVAWRIEGLEGSTSAQVLERHLPAVDGEFDAILLLVGANDALQLVPRARFERTVRALVAGLRPHLAPGGAIGVAGAPQIDTFEWLPQPLRSLMGGHARSLDDALQRIAASEPGVLHLPTPAIVDPEHHAADGFHPSAAGCSLWSSVVAPRMAQALRHEAAAVRHGIVPPFLLERLAAAASPAALVAERTLGLDRGVRAERVRGAAGRAPAGLRAPEGLRAQAAPERVPREAPVPERVISDARGTTTLPGEVVRREGDGPTGDAAADEAHDGLGASWRMLFEAFGRDSLDGAGQPLLATVHYGERYDNAFWDGERMVFGDGDGEVFAGFTRAIDVIGHELGHGVISSTANLVYRDQPGALNESIADVLGALVKQHALGQEADEADWLIGAGVFTDAVQGRALRSMAEPGTAYDDPVLGRDPQPGHMRDLVVTTDDLGGVHINSGIPNRAFHLVATAIGGRAWEAPGRIWMDALTGGLSPTADFAAFAEATTAAAAARFGDGSDEAAAVRAAWAAVGVTQGGATDAARDVEAEAVRVARTGGMLGRTRAAVLAPAAIPGDDREHLERLVDSGELAGLDAEAPPPDAPLWRVTIETRCDVTVAEPLLPEEVLALFRRLLELGDEA